jgi:hypothetical protein
MNMARLVGPMQYHVGTESPVTHGGSSSDLPVLGGDTLEVLPGEVGVVPPRRLEWMDVADRRYYGN